MSSPLSQQTTSIRPICCSSAPIPNSGPTPYLSYFLQALHGLKQQNALGVNPLFPPFDSNDLQQRICPPPSHRVIALQFCNHAPREGNHNEPNSNEKYYIFQCDIEDVGASVVKPVMDVSLAEMYPADAWREVNFAVVDHWLQEDANCGGWLWMKRDEKQEGKEVLWFCKTCNVHVWIRELKVSRG